MQLNHSMRIVSGCIKSTNLKWLPVLSHIPPPRIRREVAARKVYRKFVNQEQSLLYHELQRPTRERLKSRKPWHGDMVDEELDGAQSWRELWLADPPPNGHLIADPNDPVPGLDLPRREWTNLNRFRTGHGRCASLMYKWRFKDDPSCSCGHGDQTTSHVVNECVQRKLQGGIDELHKCSPEAVECTQS